MQEQKKSFLSEIEEKILEFWDKDKTFEKSVNERPESKPYVFYDGPPFATGLPHYGHILASTSKDMVPRYWTMKGYRVERRWGWDCHGLPIENIAEKELKISGKKAIEEMGIDKFNEFCRSKVLTYAKDWGTIVRRIGRWVDFDNAYMTMDNSYIESVWWAFKQMHGKGLIYEGKKVLLYCSRCETPISNFEIAMDNSYKDVEEETAIAKLKIKNEKLKIGTTNNTYFLAWTTTPWTLVGNLALAINKDFEYVVVAKDGMNEQMILAKSAFEKQQDLYAGYSVVETVRGEKLLDLEYEPLYEMNAGGKRGFYALDGGADVTADDGTGMVHMAMYGEFDYEMAKKYDLPQIIHLDEMGKLKEGPEAWKGVYFKKLNGLVLEDLKSRGLLFASPKHSHSYPFCYRCATPLYYAPIPAWFIAVSKIKSRLLELNATGKNTNGKDVGINWVPDHLKEGRFKNSLEGAPDWNISRNRYWASSIPVWKCVDCGKQEVFGSVQELRDKATNLKELGLEKAEIDLHKHVVDKILVECECGKSMHRIPEVIDCWVESASMPFAAEHYPFENAKKFEHSFPAQFVSEYIAQTRAWFYVCLVLSGAVFDKIPFENVVVTGTIMAEDGTKMSKSKGNYPDPMGLINRFGVDALRLYLMSSPVMKGESLNFSEKGVDEMAKKVVMLLYNVVNFYELFVTNPPRSPFDKGEEGVVSPSLVKGRVGVGFVASTPSTGNILDRWILSKLNTLITEMTEKYDRYELVDGTRLLPSFIDELSTWYVRRSRDRFKGEDEADRQSALATLGFVLSELSKLLAPVAPFTAEQVWMRLGNKTSVHLEPWPVASKGVDEKVVEEMDFVRKIVEDVHRQRAEAGVKVRQPLGKVELTLPFGLSRDLVDILKDEVNVLEVIQKKGEWKVALDTQLTEELKKAGMFRELVRQINGMRKESGLSIGDFVTMEYLSDPQLSAWIESNREILAKQVLASKIVAGGDGGKELDLDGKKLVWKIVK
ncbi:MAG: isoleucyl-tRNA synthetase [Parcubacteria group bacterium Gr01-1014_18]|nr:MAG: isoleucyl-tRNA synthetase [Parcubacteria group bacterium Greene0416_36]TSC81369.1 MAG: isoleucyl-tRNA synthetase [Parcubacteria group bacterium Gr01-1014_18]TSC99445.1 MAG: isoleucyl-tRNA synthetase [Parcubacteria group bacterium Greene1014_20]TSD07636.1 MAG: isoleucyl-tRNA synthetase [Parcubacteria group bacterium Greene0714_2]